MRLVLIRHGQTASNVDRLLDTGAPGAPLTDLGLQQARGLVEALSGERIDAVFASNLHRAQQTAAPLAADRGLEVVVRPGLREISAGDYELRNDEEAVSGYVATLAAVAAGRLDAGNPGGENGHEFLARFDEVVAEIGAHGAETVAVVSHGAMLRTWTGSRVRNLDADFILRNPLANTAIVTLDGDAAAGWLARTWAGVELDEALAHGDPTRHVDDRGF